MSITTSHLEYLLEVAENIINTCADPSTAHKYYAIKQHVWPLQQSNTQTSYFTLGSRIQENSRNLSKGKMETSTLKKRQNSKENMRSSHSSVKNTRLSRGRVQTFVSRAQQQQNNQNNTDMTVLIQLSSLLKNAMSCPKLLDSLKLQSSLMEPRVNVLLSEIEVSLQNLFRTLSKQASESRLLLPGSVDNEDRDQLIKDNRWLIEKLQMLIEENCKLRRMIGQTIR